LADFAQLATVKPGRPSRVARSHSRIVWAVLMGTHFGKMRCSL
jgi:hypothetical protein